MADRVLSIAAIEAAEELAGIRYTEAERAMIAETIAAQIDNAVKRRQAPLPYDLAPATRFDPRLPGFAMPAAEPFRPGTADPGPLPDSAEDIAFAPVTRLAGWIAARAISCERLAGMYLDRIEKLGPKLECIATVTADLAMTQAKRGDALLAEGTYLGPLHGIPWGAKDLLDTSGIVTGWGAEPFAGRVPDTDATVVRRLTEAGAVLVAKTTLGALAYGDIWYGGVTRNPWNLREGSSGSSAGSGSATAAGLVGFCIGHGDARLDRGPLHPLRHHRAAADLRAGAAHRRDGAVLDARQDRADVPQRRRHRAGARRDQRRRPGRPVQHRRAVRLRRRGARRRPAARLLHGRFRRSTARTSWTAPCSTTRARSG